MHAVLNRIQVTTDGLGPQISACHYDVSLTYLNNLERVSNVVESWLDVDLYRVSEAVNLGDCLQRKPKEWNDRSKLQINKTIKT